jgi:hypothetical protein
LAAAYRAALRGYEIGEHIANALNRCANKPFKRIDGYRGRLQDYNSAKRVSDNCVEHGTVRALLKYPDKFTRGEVII